MGCEVVDVVEQIAIDRAKNCLALIVKCAATFVHKGLAVYHAYLKPGDKIWF
jgi:glycine/serine hydroxymethyltransferase